MTYDWFPVIVNRHGRLMYVGAGNAHSGVLSGTPDFTYFGEFMTSPIHYIYFTECVNLETTFMD